MIFREDDVRYLDEILADEGMDDVEDDEDDVMDDDPTDADADAEMGLCDEKELVIKRNCDGILDIVLVGEVCTSAVLFFCYVLVLTRHNPILTLRRTFGTVRLGIITNSMVASASGMDWLRLSVFL